jgi:nucleoside phosphorylase
MAPSCPLPATKRRPDGGNDMIADRAWVRRNLGFDPIAEPPPPATQALKALGPHSEPEDFQREIIDWDSDSPAGLQFLAYSKATGMSRFKDIPWPKGLVPQTAASCGPGGNVPLPKADVLVVTWTVDEGHALSRVLTPGKDSRNDYLSYTHNYDAIAAKMRAGCPAREAHRLGAYWSTKIGGKSVLVFKSDSHMSQDGPQLPNLLVWKQIIAEVQPALVLTTGTAGGIGSACEVGDVVVSSVVRFDCTAKFKAEPFAQAHYNSAAATQSMFDSAADLFKANAEQLPHDNTRPPRIIVDKPTQLASCVVTTDFFGFDTSDNHYKLQGLGAVSEMGDAVLGLAASQLGKSAPHWLAIRNVSDPQIAADGLTLKQQAAMAAQIYKGYGRWSSVCSAIVCWASIAAMK